ncbi:MAG: peptidoglycan DD-metalloendopeptidase family protein [Flavobacteriales bacterium]|nr:peptidoglycan DD-metalloendopeptidase family protein [Flavobacteriales bacterium]
MNGNRGCLTLGLVYIMAHLSVSGQSGDLDIGGPEEVDAYRSAGDIREVTELDSALHFPAHEQYCNWEVGAIFAPSTLPAFPTHPTTLRLVHAECDHATPVCGKVNSEFGPRRGRMHYGVDIDLETGDPVFSAFPGMVRIARYDRSFGNVVVVRHWNGLETLYAHFSKIKVKPGDLVEAGDTLGSGGSTGRSTGPHLHFEVRYLGRAIDPRFIFDVEEGSLKSPAYTITPGVIVNPASQRSYHVVRRGDTLSSLARRYGTTVGRLCQMNKLSSRSVLRVGQRVRYQ